MPKQFQPTRIRDPKKVMRFGSKCGTPSARALSNFHKITLTLKRSHFSPLLLQEFPILDQRFPDARASATFLSTEAAWQALKARNLRTYQRFEASGDLGGEVTPASFAPFLPRKHREDHAKRATKYHHWIESKKGIRYDNVGILSKMAANPKYRTALGMALGDMTYDREYLHANVEEEIWMTLLHAKAQQNPSIQRILRKHRGHQFVEFSRGAKAQHQQGKAEVYWAGYDDPTDQLVYGRNRMGEFVEKLAEEVS